MENTTTVHPLESGFRLGRWRVEPSSGTIQAGGLESVENHVEPRAMQVLLALAHQPGTFISKDELIQDVWAGRVVTDDCLTRAIHSLRQALGDDPRAPEFIETRTNVGYRLLVAPVLNDEKKRRYRVAAFATAAAVLVGVGLLLWQQRAPVTPDLDAPRTIAVLPFLHISDSPEQSYLALAMTEALTTGLAQQPGLQVISRTSVMSPESTEGDATAIARALGADLLVEGSVQSSKGQVRVTAQLIDAVRDDHLWAEQFDRPLDDVLALQADISRAITQQITSVVVDSDLLPQQALPALAMSDYLHHRYLLAQGSDIAVEAALVGFEQLIAEHPDFAPAHLGKAQALLHLFKGMRREPSALLEARRSALAFETLANPTAESRRNLGQVVLMSEWDFDAAEQYYRDAIALNPSDTVARRRYAWLLVAEQRYPEAVHEIDRIRMLDPMYFEAADIATLLLYADQVEESIVEFERLDEIAQLSAPVLRVMASAYREAGREADAQRTLLRMLDVSGKLRPGQLEWLAEQDIDAVYEHILTARPFRSTIIAAGFEYLLGRTDRAIAELERAVDRRDPYVLYLDALPEFTSLRSDPRFQALLARIGVIQEKQQLSDDLRLSSVSISVLQPGFRESSGVPDKD